MTMGTASHDDVDCRDAGDDAQGASRSRQSTPRMAEWRRPRGRIVEMVWEDLKPSDILTPEAFDNAIAVDMAIGGSTNAIIHLIAMAGRAGIKLPLERFDEISQKIPVIANLRPSGEFLMEDFYDAGGLGHC